MRSDTMSNLLQVHVTEEDIHAGEKHGCYTCPVALAMLRAAKDRQCGANVFRDNDYRLRCELWSLSVLATSEVREFVHAYDEGFAVEPFAFTLPAADAPEWKESCGNCGACVPQGEIDEDGVCEECREEQT